VEEKLSGRSLYAARHKRLPDIPVFFDVSAADGILAPQI
jgi:hypothetical protein